MFHCYYRLEFSERYLIPEESLERELRGLDVQGWYLKGPCNGGVESQFFLSSKDLRIEGLLVFLQGTRHQKDAHYRYVNLNLPIYNIGIPDHIGRYWIYLALTLGIHSKSCQSLLIFCHPTPLSLCSSCWIYFPIRLADTDVGIWADGSSNPALKRLIQEQLSRLGLT